GRNQTLVFVPSQQSIKVHIDKSLIRMMLENIIDNAGKYSPKGGEVSVSAIKTQGELVLEVTDQGIGIAKQDQKKLFRKFSRLNNSHTGKVNGSGLGLYWAKKVVLMHGGSISLTSEPKKGSTFTIKLPM